MTTSWVMNRRSDRLFLLFNAVVSIAGVSFIAVHSAARRRRRRRCGPFVHARGECHAQCAVGNLSRRRVGGHPARVDARPPAADGDRRSPCRRCSWWAISRITTCTATRNTPAPARCASLYFAVLISHIVLSITVVAAGADVVLPGVHQVVRAPPAAEPRVPADLAVRVGHRRADLLFAPRRVAVLLRQSSSRSRWRDTSSRLRRSSELDDDVVLGRGDRLHRQPAAFLRHHHLLEAGRLSSACRATRCPETARRTPMSTMYQTGVSAEPASSKYLWPFFQAK